MTLYERVQALCSKNNISIARLEKECRLGNATIRGWKTSAPTVDTLSAVAAFFGVSIDFLLSDAEANEENGERNSFSLRLKELRVAAGYTQQSFADAFGVAQSTVGNWEAGRRETELETLLKIADFFGVSLDYLAGVSEKGTSSERLRIKEARQRGEEMSNMTLEEQLHNKILEKYKSVRAFTQEISVPYSTLDNILKRPNGINNSGVNLIGKIFDALDLDIYSIATGTLAFKKPQMLRRIADICGVTVDYLLGGPEEEPSTERSNDVLAIAVETWGKDAQIDIAVEELSELIKALLKERRAVKTGCDAHIEAARKNVAEEMADVYIMLSQLGLIFHNRGEVQKQIDYKANRLFDRICEENEKV